MKNYLTLVLAVLMVSTTANASRARLESLGEGKNGSYYIQDSRNIFLNPAQIVHYKKKLSLEFGNEPGATQDTSLAPRGQGGFTNTFGDFTYGVYMNQTSERELYAISSANALGGAFIAPESQLEFTFAGEGAMNWGFSLLYAGNNTKGVAGAAEKTASLFGVRLGVESGNLQAFSSIGIASDSKVKNASTDEVKGKVSVDVAVTYKMDEMTDYAHFSSYGTDVTLSTLNSGNVVQNRNTAFGLGAGWKHDMSKSTTMFCRVSGDYLKTTTTSFSDITTWNVPIVVGAEAVALSWLTIRGSIAESILGQTNGSIASGSAYRTSLSGLTTVAAGVGMTFGDVVIDGLVSSNGATNSANGIPGFGTGQTTGGTFGFGDNMLSRVAMTYNF